MHTFNKLLFVSFSFVLLVSSLYSIVPTPTGQRMIEESNKIYSGNKYNLPQDQYNRLQRYDQNQAYPYYYSYPGYYYSYPGYYGYNYSYGYPNYGYPYYGSSFPDSDEADALYWYIQNR